MTKTFASIVFSSLIGAQMACASIFSKPSNQPPVQVVPSVDVNKYMGKWYDIASIPQFFQRICAANTTAEYSLLPEGGVKVDNSCDKKDGTRARAIGHAKIVDATTNAKLKVTFLKLHRWIYTWGGDYWVIELDSHYDWAVVGHPKRTYGWIISRTPSLSKFQLVEIEQKIRAQGYDSCRFMTTPQEGGITEKVRLCDYVKSLNGY